MCGWLVVATPWKVALRFASLISGVLSAVILGDKMRQELYVISLAMQEVVNKVEVKLLFHHTLCITLYSQVPLHLLLLTFLDEEMAPLLETM